LKIVVVSVKRRDGRVMLDAAPAICGKTFAEPREVYTADMNERSSLLMARDPANHFPYFTYAGR